ncbi:MAG: hypothetical protein ACRYE9_05835 [Janthinobacterium lividum]
MPNKKQNVYSSESKESSVKLAIDSQQPILPTAKELAICTETLHGGISNCSCIYKINI